LIAAAPQADIMIFFDDDFIPDPEYLAAIERHMAGHPTVVVATGLVLEDGIGGPGFAVGEAEAVLRIARQADRRERQQAIGWRSGSLPAGRPSGRYTPSRAHASAGKADCGVPGRIDEIGLNAQAPQGLPLEISPG